MAGGRGVAVWNNYKYPGILIWTTGSFGRSKGTALNTFFYRSNPPGRPNITKGDQNEKN